MKQYHITDITTPSDVQQIGRFVCISSQHVSFEALNITLELIAQHNTHNEANPSPPVPLPLRRLCE